jgi:CPA1 family monovalent cation:H+ antiporter
VNDFFEVVDFLINSVLFLLIGLEIRAIRAGGWENIADNLHLVGAGIVALLVARAVVVYPLFHFLNIKGMKRPGSWAHVLFWGGLRGSIPIALLLGLPAGMPWRKELVLAGFGVVLFSLVVQGLTVMPLLKWLRLTATQAAGKELES